jgi:branched-chain amino acid aminotransferase
MNVTSFAIENNQKIIKLQNISDESSLDAVSRQLPQGIYSTFRTLGDAQKVLGLQAHLDRLYGPAAQKGITPSVSQVDLRQAIKMILMNFGSLEARVRISLSLTEQPGQIFVILEPLKLLDEIIYREGIRVSTSAIERENPRLKSTTFIQISAMDRKKLVEKDVFEILMVKNGRILEGLTSNFFALKNSKIITARDGILLGVTRRVILRLIRQEGVGIEYRSLRMDEVPFIDEAFITSSSRGVVPVISVDGSPVGQGQPGKISRRLRLAYDDYVSSKAEMI